MMKYYRQFGVPEDSGLDMREAIILERGSFCEHCGRPTMGAALELHHCLIHRMKGHKELNTPENLMLVCHACHQEGEVNGWDVRVKFWRKQIERGYDMYRWLDGLKIRNKPNFGGEE